jgi:hypothetical protein
MFPSVDLQGNVLSAEVLDLVSRGELPGQKPKEFNLPAESTVDRAIGEAWAAARAYWKAFSEKRARLKDDDSGVTITRRNWITLLLGEMGYELEAADAEEINEKKYPISHRVINCGNLPVHIMGVNDGLDVRRASGQPRLSPHALVQEYLNHSEHVYGLVTNGLQLRLLRDSMRLGRLAYVEFNLERIFDQEIYTDFVLLFRLLHATRMPTKAEAAAEAFIEAYHQKGIDDGTRIKELRKAVKDGMEVLANGLLNCNPQFADAALKGKLDPKDYYAVLMRTIYRMLFLIVIEERDLVHPIPKGDRDAINTYRDVYRRFYSLSRLRKLTLRSAYIDGRKQDLWQSLMSTFRLFESDGYGRSLEIAPLGGDLFGRSLAANDHDLHALKLDNASTLRILEGLTITRNDQGVRVPVNYSDLDVEELGSIYEGLLELHPRIDNSSGTPLFGFTEGSQRKLTGSYYTRHDLVAQLIRTALEPVMEERLKGKRTKEEKEAAILGMSVVDPACGSGHFLLAAARNMAQRLAEIRSEEENPGRSWVLAARRDVISRCIYGVDKNPAAIELCRLALWLEAHISGKPLTFLEHRIRPGDALVGVDRLERLKEGIPDGAFEPVTGDDGVTATVHRSKNRRFRETGQYHLFSQQLQLTEHMDRFAEGFKSVDALRNDDMDTRLMKEAIYKKFKSDRGWWKNKVACDLYTYAFFQHYTQGTKENEVVDTELLLRQLNSAGSVNASLEAKAINLSQVENFFHWPLEFPEIAQRGGFDVILANPPWERIKLQEKEFFETRDQAIAQALNAAVRKRLIAQLESANPKLWTEYRRTLHSAEGSSRFVRESDRFPLTGRGDVNTYSVFAELIVRNLSDTGRGGFIVPTGISTDDGNKYFFGHLVQNNHLVSLYDFQNATPTGRFFPNVHPQYKFVLATVRAFASSESPSFGFYLQDILELNDPRKVFSLNYDDFLRINPNTKTCPIFRTRQDADLTTKIYKRVPVLLNEELRQNPWRIKFNTMLHMSNDSNLFRTSEQLKTQGYRLKGNRYKKGENTYLPLYESKMIWHYDHRYGSYERAQGDGSGLPATTVEEYQTPAYLIQPRYWVEMEKIGQANENIWHLGFRDITNATNERTTVFDIIPRSAVGHVMPLLNGNNKSLLISMTNSLVFDWVSRNKVAGLHMTYGYLKQLPVLVPTVISIKEAFVVELVYTSWDIKGFADDLWRSAEPKLREAISMQWNSNRQVTGGHSWIQPEWKDAYPEIDWEFKKGDEQAAKGGIPFPPFKWDDERRALLRAELDAHYALLYGLERDELRYILDPKEVHGKDFPGESFRVLKDKEIREFGEYRTQRLVLEAYDRLRPTWDMPAHLERLRVEYDRLQQPNTTQPPEAKAKKTKGTGKKKGSNGAAQEGSELPFDTAGSRKAAEKPAKTPKTKQPKQQAEEPIKAVSIADIDREKVLQTIRQVFLSGAKDRESALREVAYRLGVQRLGKKNRKTLETDFLTAVKRRVIVNEGDHLRIMVRTFEEYEKDDLKKNFLTAIGTIWTDRDESIRLLARHLGFARTSPEMDERVRSIIRGLLIEGKLEKDGRDWIRRV